MVNVAMVTSWRVRCGIAAYSEELSTELSRQGVNVYIIRLPRFGNKTAGLVQNIARSIPTDKVDLIHVQHEYGLFLNLEAPFYQALRGMGKPIITTMHTVGSWNQDNTINAFSDAIIVHNEFCYGRFERGKTQKVGIIPHGAKPRTTPPPPREECKKQVGLQAKAPIVGYLGFVSPYKGLETLIEAMTKVKEAGLLIGGGWHIEREPQYIVKLKNLTLRTLPARCRWLGYVSDWDLEKTYGAMDVFVYPSRFATESGALIRALSHGKAVIASNLAPYREKKKVGALMTFKTVPDLVRKINLLLKNDDKREALERKALQYAKKNSWKEIARRHIRLYKSVLQTERAKKGIKLVV